MKLLTLALLVAGGLSAQSAGRVPFDPPARYLTEADLGVPSWFASDGCTRPGRNRDWTFVGCRLHDWLYADGWWIDDPDGAREARLFADRAMRAVNRHNSGWRPEGGRIGFWGRVKRRLEVWVQFFGVSESARGVYSFRMRREGPLRLLPPAEALRILAAEGKVSTKGGDGAGAEDGAPHVPAGVAVVATTEGAN